MTISICVLALYIHRHRQGRTGRIDDLLISMTGGVQKHVFYLVNGSRTLADHYLFLVHTKGRNEELEKEVTILRSALAALQEVKLESIRLRELLRFQQEVAFKMIPAHVIAHDVSSDYVGIRVDRGSEHGVRQGMGVVSPSGVVGRVLRVAPGYSDILTIVDPTSNVDVMVQQSRARGILSGQSKQLTCKLKYVDRLEEVVVNDTVVSSGFGFIFPKGLLVGYVTAVIPNLSGVTQTITIKSAVDMYRLEEVFIVSSPIPEATS